MLIRDHIVFILGIDRLMVRRNVDIVVGELVAAEVIEEVCKATGGEVDVSSG
jgi:hypothetical protein